VGSAGVAALFGSAEREAGMAPQADVMFLAMGVRLSRNKGVNSTFKGACEVLCCVASMLDSPVAPHSVVEIWMPSQLPFQDRLLSKPSLNIAFAAVSQNKMGNNMLTLVSGYLLKKKTMIEMVDMKRTPKVQICDERPLISK